MGKEKPQKQEKQQTQEKAQKPEKTKKAQKDKFLKKSLLDPKDMKQANQSLVFNNLRSNIESIKKIEGKPSKYIYENFPFEHVHYSIIKLGLKMCQQHKISHYEISLEFLESIRDLILEIEDNDKIFTRYIEEKLEVIRNILSEYTRLDETLMNLFNYLFKLLKIINLEADFEKAKMWFVDKIDDYIERRFLTAEKMLVDHGSKIIKNNENILVISISEDIMKTLIKCVKNNIVFKVFLVLDKVHDEVIKETAMALQKLDIKVICTPSSNLSYFMNQIHKVFSGGYCMYSNGYLTAQSGTAIAAIFAKKFRKPFYVFMRTFKFSNKIQIDSLMINESFAGENNNVVCLEKDLVPDRLISLIVTEIGLMPPTTVPVILREFNMDFEKIIF